MPHKPNKLARVLVPLALIAIGIGVLAAVWVNQTKTVPPRAPASGQATPNSQTQAAKTPKEAAEQGATEPSDQTGTPQDEQAAPEQPVMLGADVGLHARVFDTPLQPVTLGASTDDDQYTVQIVVSPLGVGLESIRLSKYFETIERQKWSVLQTDHSFPDAMVVPFAALDVSVGGPFVSLVGSAAAPVWREIEGQPGSFEAFIDDENDKPVVRIVRTWRVDPGSYDIVLEQRIENLSGHPLDVRMDEFGPVDLPRDSVTYGGDKRRWRFGYLEKPSLDPNREHVLGDAYATQGRRALLKKDKGGYPTVDTVWPNPTSTKNDFELAWAGATNRYFTVTAHPLVDSNSPSPDKTFKAVETIDRIVPNPFAERPEETLIALRFDTGRRRLDPGGTLDLSMGIYAGPLSREVIASTPVAAAAGLDELIVLSFGGPCAPCTFQWMTGILLGLLRFLHNYVVFDWALAIMVLVLIVRTTLHPITRWSQIRMQRFGKQMQALGPKQKKIQEKYKGDQKKVQEEMAKLMREEGLNPAGMLGCLPMFLQTPIWIALYATLYFAVDLQHKPAFFGVVQKLVPLNSPFLGRFLGDLSEPDRFIYFGGKQFHVPFISNLMGPISSINILPIFLGIVFFIHQKYLTPPTTGTMSPEQEQQQKIMKVLMVVMFPFIMYNAPSGLAIYFICNSSLGIIESRLIRKHAEEKGLLEPKKNEAGKPGLMGRLMALAEQQRSSQTGGFKPAQRVPKGRGPQPRRPRGK